MRLDISGANVVQYIVGYYCQILRGWLTVIAVIDYGAGNLRSVVQGLVRLGASPVVTRDAATIAVADGLVLPGVGAFGDAMAALRQADVIPAMTAAVTAGVPFLGICLGMQMLFSDSDESPGVCGLNWLPGHVVSLRQLPNAENVKIPHMGWNTLEPHRASSLLAGIAAEDYFYFVHGYACAPDDEADILTSTSYGSPFCSSVQRGNLFGVQYHPEKSGDVGAQMLRNFLKLCP